MTEMEKLRAGLAYNYVDPELNAQKHRAIRLCEELNAVSDADGEAKEEVIRRLFGSAGEKPRVLSDFHCDAGENIHVGDRFLANYNVTILDRAEVHIGDNVLLAPGVLITTVNHAMNAAERRENICVAMPVVLGDDVWVGGNATILPGVHIGNNVIVAAGAVVNRDVPDNCLVAGVPARVIRTLD